MTYTKHVRTEPGIDVVDVGIDVFTDNLAAVIDGLFLNVEYDRHVVIRRTDDAEYGKLHIRFSQFGIILTQAADSTIQSFVSRGKMSVRANIDRIYMCRIFKIYEY